jgi:hypothetical protein
MQGSKRIQNRRRRSPTDRSTQIAPTTILLYSVHFAAKKLPKLPPIRLRPTRHLHSRLKPLRYNRPPVRSWLLIAGAESSTTFFADRSVGRSLCFAPSSIAERSTTFAGRSCSLIPFRLLCRRPLRRSDSLCCPQFDRRSDRPPSPRRLPTSARFP